MDDVIIYMWRPLGMYMCMYSVFPLSSSDHLKLHNVEFYFVLFLVWLEMRF